MTSKTQIRSDRQELIFFLLTLRLYVLAGYDLAYGWHQSVLELGMERFSWKREGRFGDFLKSLERSLPDEQGTWFLVLAELYERGAPLAQGVGAFIDSVMADQQRDLERHQRILPTQMNVLLILFFLPPLFVICVFPLLFSFVE